MLLPGDQLEELCTQARSEIIFVAPFIKTSALERLLSIIPNAINLSCVTRWRPEEIIAGVSDLDVWHLITRCENASLWLRPDLHAKYYRSDHNCLVGSANITSTALGWLRQANLELLVPLSAQEPQLKKFESELFLGSVQVSQTIFEQMQQTVELLQKQLPEIQNFRVATELELEVEAFSIVTAETWLPALRNPEDLYLAYHGRFEELSRASCQAVLQDLSVLTLPVGLSKSAFQVYVGSLILQMPIVNRVDKFLEIPQRFGAVKDLLTSLLCNQNLEFDAAHAWQTLMRWLRYFLPSRYTLSIPNHSEVFGRSRTSI
ncbi:MAG: phospholipase D family protein [Tildeniella torsiva UHER 1998/13D]|jgi:hypothetical protein|nr:phospholipase D family protein [Tildeniella torsiva UHER 1998/13D]